MAITADDVVASIEMILGRTPDAALVDYHVGMGFQTRAELGIYMMSTDEFRDKLAKDGPDLGSWEGKAAAGRERRARLATFGSRAFGIIAETNQGLFVVDPEDNAVSAALLTAGEYGQEELALASRFLNTSSQVLVVGTHIGAIAVPLSKRCAAMDAVEANPVTQRLIEANLRLNGCNNVTLHKVAASDKLEKIAFLLNRENSGGSKRKPLSEQIYYVYDDPEEVLVDAVPLDEICGDKIFDLVFMDIEGSEYFALKGMSRILSSARTLCIEFLPHHIREVAGVRIAEMIDLIEPHFSWLYVPGLEKLVKKSDIRSELTAMYDRGEGHAGIYFMKTASDQWLQNRTSQA